MQRHIIIETTTLIAQECLVNKEQRYREIYFKCYGFRKTVSLKRLRGETCFGLTFKFSVIMERAINYLFVLTVFYTERVRP